MEGLEGVGESDKKTMLIEKLAKYLNNDIHTVQDLSSRSQVIQGFIFSMLHPLFFLVCYGMNFTDLSLFIMFAGSFQPRLCMVFLLKSFFLQPSSESSLDPDYEKNYSLNILK